MGPSVANPFQDNPTRPGKKFGPFYKTKQLIFFGFIENGTPKYKRNWMFSRFRTQTEKVY
jgi:hypothetical protein